MAREMTTKAREAIASAARPRRRPETTGRTHSPAAVLVEQRDGIALSLLGAVRADTRNRRAPALGGATQYSGASAGSAQASRTLLAVVQDAESARRAQETSTFHEPAHRSGDPMPRQGILTAGRSLRRALT